MTAADRVVRVIAASDGRHTPHDGRYVVGWNPHTKAGMLALTSTEDVAKARRFTMQEIFTERRITSRVQARRPWDGRPNRPLSGISIEIIWAP